MAEHLADSRFASTEEAWESGLMTDVSRNATHTGHGGRFDKFMRYSALMQMNNFVGYPEYDLEAMVGRAITINELGCSQCTVFRDEVQEVVDRAEEKIELGRLGQALVLLISLAGKIRWHYGVKQLHGLLQITKNETVFAWAGMRWWETAGRLIARVPLIGDRLQALAYSQAIEQVQRGIAALQDREQLGAALDGEERVALMLAWGRKLEELQTMELGLLGEGIWSRLTGWGRVRRWIVPADKTYRDKLIADLTSEGLDAASISAVAKQFTVIAAHLNKDVTGKESDASSVRLSVGTSYGARTGFGATIDNLLLNALRDYAEFLFLSRVTHGLTTIDESWSELEKLGLPPESRPSLEQKFNKLARAPRDEEFSRLLRPRLRILEEYGIYKSEVSELSKTELFYLLGRALWREMQLEKATGVSMSELNQLFDELIQFRDTHAESHGVILPSGDYRLALVGNKTQLAGSLKPSSPWAGLNILIDGTEEFYAQIDRIAALEKNPTDTVEFIQAVALHEFGHAGQAAQNRSSDGLPTYNEAVTQAVVRYVMLKLRQVKTPAVEQNSDKAAKRLLNALTALQEKVGADKSWQSFYATYATGLYDGEVEVGGQKYYGLRTQYDTAFGKSTFDGYMRGHSDYDIAKKTKKVRSADFTQQQTVGETRAYMSERNWWQRFKDWWYGQQRLGIVLDQKAAEGFEWLLSILEKFWGRVRDKRQLLSEGDFNNPEIMEKIRTEGLGDRFKVRFPESLANVDQGYLKNYDEASVYILDNIDSAVNGDAENWYRFLDAVRKIQIGVVGVSKESYSGVSDMTIDEGFRNTKGTIVTLPLYILKLLLKNYRDLRNNSSIVASDYGDYVSKTGITLDLDKSLSAFNIGYDYEAVLTEMQEVKELARLALIAKDEEQTVELLAKAYFRFRSHPYTTVNNSVSMNLINAILTLKGYRVMPHLLLDYQAYGLTEDDFVDVFRWNYYTFAEYPYDVARSEVARQRQVNFTNYLDKLKSVQFESNLIPEMPAEISLVNFLLNARAVRPSEDTFKGFAKSQNFYYGTQNIEQDFAIKSIPQPSDECGVGQVLGVSDGRG